MLYQLESSQYCPYCGEPIELLIDESAGAQSYYEDCAVCCRPILILVSEDDLGELSVVLYRDDD